MAPINPRCTIRTKIKTKDVHVTSLAECSRRTIILVGNFLEVGIGTKATALGRRRTFVVAIFNLGGGYMKVVTINIRSVDLDTPDVDGELIIL